MIKKNQFSVAMGSVALLMTTATLAVPFNSFDPKSMAMGGAGVAVANPSTASFFNPALLSIAETKDDFAIEFPVFGVRVYDPDDFADAVDDFNDTAFDDLDAAINGGSIDGVPVTGFNNDSLNPASVTPVTTSINSLNTEIEKISDKPLELEGGIGLVVGIPGEKFGMALSASASFNFSGIFEYRDKSTVDSLTSDMDLLASCLGDPVLAVSAACAADKFTFVTITGDVGSTADPDINFTTEDDIESQVQIIGVAMEEVGLSFSREMAMFGTEVAVGVTPKMVSVTIFDYKADADSADTDNIDGDDYSADYSDFNLDIGIAMDHKNGWRSGLVIKNIISQDYDAMNINDQGDEVPTGTVVSLKPQARAGVSHTNGWSTVALDVDLTENEALGEIGNNSRYIALGVELNALDWAQLRFGYRADTVNSERNVMSAGFGVSPFGIHIDLGVAGNQNEVGASFQLGFRF